MAPETSPAGAGTPSIGTPSVNSPSINNRFVENSYIDSRAGRVEVGTVLSWRTSYTEQDVRDYCLLTGAPTEPLPATLPYLLVIAPLTKLGGDLNYLSARMSWTVLAQVSAGQQLTAELEVTELDPAPGMTKIAFAARILAGTEVVLTGHSRGVVLAEPS